MVGFSGQGKVWYLGPQAGTHFTVWNVMGKLGEGLLPGLQWQGSDHSNFFQGIPRVTLTPGTSDKHGTVYT